MTMTSRERFVRTLTGRPVDRVPFMKVFGGPNAIVPQWEQECPGIGKTIDGLLGFEGANRGWTRLPVNMALASLGPSTVLADDGRARTIRHGDGTVEIRISGADYYHQTIEYPVKNRADWERIKAKHLRPDDPARYSADWPAPLAANRDREFPLQLTHGGVYGFARNLMGDEALLYAFVDEPALVHDIMDTYTSFAIEVWSGMVRELDFDLIECWEDMASRNGMFISPTMFREFMKPNYERLAQFARAHGIEVILVDSDGLIEELAGLMVESGVNAMYPFEVQSGNDVPRMRERYPELAAVGGLDKNVMARDRKAIDAEIAKARRLIELGRFIPGPDHFVLSDVSWANYRYFMEHLRETVFSTRPAAEC